MTLNRANEDLKIKHPLHVHCNNLGVPGNISTIVDTIKAAEGKRMHLAHVQFYAYDNKGKKVFHQVLWNSLKLLIRIKI